MKIDLDSVQERVIEQYKHLSPYLPAIFFIGGFFFDIATLGRIDNIMNIVSHGVYLACTMALLILQIIGYHPAPDSGKIKKYFFEYLNDAIHFMLGALLNAFVIFYFKSGSFINTFLLVVILFTLLVMNEVEFFKKQGPTLKVILFTISLSSFFVYLIPVMIGEAGGGIFMLSQICAIFVLLGMWQVLAHLGTDPARIKNRILIPAGTVILVFSILYAARIIPPIPLALKQIGIYHNVKHQDGEFILTTTTPPWKFWSQGDQDFSAQPDDRIYLFTRIFAPGGFHGKLYLHFQIKDRKGDWQTTDKIPMNIVGGRDEGFRGYAYKKNYREGKWRALVETDEGREVGRIDFEVTKTEADPERQLFKEIQ